MDRFVSIVFGVKGPINYMPVLSKAMIILGFVVTLINQIEEQGWRTFISFVIILVFLYDITKMHLKLLEDRRSNN